MENLSSPRNSLYKKAAEYLAPYIPSFFKKMWNSFFLKNLINEENKLMVPVIIFRWRRGLIIMFSVVMYIFISNLWKPFLMTGNGGDLQKIDGNLIISYSKDYYGQIPIESGRNYSFAIQTRDGEIIGKSSVWPCAEIHRDDISAENAVPYDRYFQGQPVTAWVYHDMIYQLQLKDNTIQHAADFENMLQNCRLDVTLAQKKAIQKNYIRMVILSCLSFLLPLIIIRQWTKYSIIHRKLKVASLRKITIYFFLFFCYMLFQFFLPLFFIKNLIV
jgi:hypothetical protein